MDLLYGYGSDSGSDSDAEKQPSPAAPTPKTKPKAAPSLLPSAADAFSSVASASFLVAPRPTSAPDVQPMKKQKATEDDAPTLAAARGGGAAGKVAERPKSSGMLMPPQLSGRANTATEDVSRWTTAKGGKGGKGRGESFNSKEKRKRQEGKSSREGSFVEEEKRMLRQAGAD